MSKKKNNNIPLSKKQRKKLEKRGVNMKENAPRRQRSKIQKWTIAMIATVCALSIAFCTFGGILLADVIKEALTDPYASVYETLTMERYLATDQMGAGFYKGNEFDFSGLVKAYAPKDLSYMDEYIFDVRLDHRTLVKAGQKQTELGWGDDISFYITSILDKDGKQVPTSEMPIGSYLMPLTDENGSLPVLGRGYLGDDFDQKIEAMKLKPETMGRELRQNGVLEIDETKTGYARGDIVCLSYSIYKSTGTADSNATDLIEKYSWSESAESTYSRSGVRVQLLNGNDIEQVLAKAMIDNHTELGEDFSFVLENYDLTGNETDKGAYRVDANIHFVVLDEKTVDVKFKIPEGFFGGADGNTILSLNGQEVTFTIMIVSSNDYNLPEFNRAFITGTLGMEISATDDAGAVAEYKQKQLEMINAELAETLYNNKIRQMYLNLAEKASVYGYLINTEYPSSLASSVRESAYRDLVNAYVSSYGQSPQSEEALNSFAQQYAYYQTGDSSITTYSAYLEMVVQSQVTQELIMYYVFRDAEIEVTEEEMNAKFEEKLAELVASTDDPETYTREYFISSYGGEVAMKKQMRRDLVYEKVGAYLLENNTGKEN